MPERIYIKDLVQEEHNPLRYLHRIWARCGRGHLAGPGDQKLSVAHCLCVVQQLFVYQTFALFHLPVIAFLSLKSQITTSFSLVQDDTYTSFYPTALEPLMF